MIPPARLSLAALWMSGAIASFTLMAVAGREVQTEMNTFELMLYRSVIGWAIVVALMLRTGTGLSHARTAHPRLHVLRNLAHFTGQNMWFYGVMVLPLGQLVALEFTNPIWVAILAPFMLGEAFTRTKLVAVALGFIGVLIVAQPGASPVGPGHAAALGAALGFALNTIYTKRLMDHDSVLTVLFWMTASQAVMALILALPGGIPWPSAPVLPWVVVVGVAGLTAHFSLTSALGVAPATLVAPMEFLRLPVIATVGMLVYGEPLVAAVFVGAAVIIAGNVVNMLGARTRGQRPSLPPSPGAC